MTDLPAWVRSLFERRNRYHLAWFLAIAFAAGRIANGHVAFRDSETNQDKRRVDGNRGHVSIDFGGQWIMGRMLALGHGKELYSRPRQWEVTRQAYPPENGSPTETEHDHEKLMEWFIGKDDPRYEGLAGTAAAVVGSTNPFAQAAVAVKAHEDWPPEVQRELAHPTGNPGIGGPLYPPIHSFLMYPFATGDHPQIAYFAMQWVQTLLCFLAGLGVSRLSNGRFWWPLASALILVYPGCRGTVDLGQNSALSLTLLIWGWVWMARGSPLVGGLLWGGLAYKPVWAVSFLLMLLLMRRWREALAMSLTGAGLVLATVPFVGVQSWLNWLAIGQEAARIYNLDGNWVPLSRDLLGIPRRLLLDFSLPRSERENVLALAASWALWALVIEITLRVWALRGRQPIPFTGPVPAFFILATWMCTYHFMYYDALISCFAVAVMLADPRPFFRAKSVAGEDVPVSDPLDSGKRRSVLLWNSFVLTLLGIIIFHENVTTVLKLEATGVIETWATERTHANGAKEMRPRLVLGTSDRYPIDTLLLMVLWAWCGFWTLAAPVPREPDAQRG